VLRVLQVTPRMAPHIGGVETHVREVAKRMRELDVTTAVLTTDVSGELAPREVIDGFPVERIPAWPRSSDYLLAPQIFSRIRAEDWDLVHVQCFHSFVAPFAMRAALRAGVPFVLTFHAGGHSSRLRNAIRRPQLLALRPLLRRAQKLVAIADFEIEHYGRILHMGRERFVSIPNGSDLPAPTPGSERADGTLIVSSGRLEEYKGHQRVIAAMPHVLARIPDARLWIAGRGPYEQALREHAGALGLNERVEISAVSDRQSMADRLGGASLGVMLSTFETQPLAALEALSLGVPLVVADNSGLAELARKQLARAVRLDDPPSLHAQAMVEQILHPQAVADFTLPSWDTCAESLARLYRTVATQRAQHVAVCR